ncbi:20S proteasome, A and B subunits [Mycobacteroides abscessus subsp. abscessus]|nr:20S proteasome, A and B subunits [Mycobacteroides abscessus subsp. abscessus]
MKKLYRSDLDADSALAIAVESLYDAADDDSATGGPDIVRKIFPTAVVVSAEGAQEVPPADIEAAARAIIERRAAEHEEAPR